MPDEVRVYTAESKTKRIGDVVREMIEGLSRSRYIAYRLAVKDIKGDYSKSAFGMVWDLIDPLVLGMIFYALMVVKVIHPGEMHMPYAVFVIYGLLLFATWSDSLMLMLGVFKKSRGLLNQLRVPYEALILAVAFRVAFNSIFRIAVMLLFSLVLHYQITPQKLGLTVDLFGGEKMVQTANHSESAPAPAQTQPKSGDDTRSFSPVGFLKFLALFPVLILSGIAIGLFLAPFDAIYSDVGRVTVIILTPLRYVTPVLWPIHDVGVFKYLNHINPVGPFISDLRLLATADMMQQAVGFASRVGFYSVLFLVAWFIFHVSVPVLAERA